MVKIESQEVCKKPRGMLTDGNQWQSERVHIPQHEMRATKPSCINAGLAAVSLRTWENFKVFIY